MVLAIAGFAMLILGLVGVMAFGNLTKGEPGAFGQPAYAGGVGGSPTPLRLGPV